MKLFEKHPKTRWAIPIGVVVAAIGTTLATGAFADNSPELPERSAEQLITEMMSDDLPSFQGSIVTHADLGIPADSVSDFQNAEFATLVAGSHTLRVWATDVEHLRVAMLGEASESDFIRNGDTVWTWSSEKNTAVRMSASEESESDSLPSELPTTPQGLAKKFLEKLQPTTDISVDGTQRVAGRSAYELQLDPISEATLIDSVQISVDAETSLPLQVEVYTKGSSSPAFEIGFTQISFTRPSDEHFNFTPPEGADVKDLRGESASSQDTEPQLSTEGEMWETVFIADDIDLTTLDSATHHFLPQPPEETDTASYARDVLSLLPRVSGEWGSGRLLTSKLFTVLFTEDMSVYAGFVTPERLYEVARSHE